MTAFFENMNWKNSLKLLTLGCFNGLVIVISVLSIGFFLFPAKLSIYAPFGTSIALLSSALVCILLALKSQFKSVVSMAQDTSIAVLLLANLAIAQKVATLFPHTSPLPTILVGITLSGLIVGISLYLLGKYQLGNLFRYIPYPVIGGFLVGTGFFILEGSWGVLTTIHFPPLDQITTLFTKTSIICWVPGIIVGIILYLLERFSRVIYYPYLFFLSVTLIFYAFLFLGHTSFTQAREMGLLFNNPPNMNMGILYQQFDLLAVHWSILLKESFYLLLLAILTPIGLLLNASAIEVITEKKVDFNDALKTAGIANTVSSSMGGGVVGYHALGLAAFNQHFGVNSRSIGIIAGIFCLGMLFFGVSLLNYLPRFPFAGVLVALGLNFVINWLYDSWFKLDIWDYSVIIIIAILIIFEGFLVGFIAGILLAAIIFAFNYSQGKIIKSILTSKIRRSNVDRNDYYKKLLSEQGDAIYIIQLQGYLFFGNTNNAVAVIIERLENTDLLDIHYLIIDFKDVPAIDSSSVLCFCKLITQADQLNISLVFTGISSRIKLLLENELQKKRKVYFFNDLDHGLEWCEDAFLNQLSPIQIYTTTFEKALAPFALNPGDTAQLLSFFEALSVPENFTLISQGELHRNMYFIESGSVEIFLIESSGIMTRLRTIQAGSVVGEMGLYLNRARTATVITKEPCQLYQMTQEQVEFLEKNYPHLMNIFNHYIACQSMLRLAYSNELISALLYGR
ncbi:MAG: SLC26A/SulP transporter family protein [Legionellales bacterium]|nr:SLC26A/SulP transporter family protein [Legionellales bacterium]